MSTTFLHHFVCTFTTACSDSKAPQQCRAWAQQQQCELKASFMLKQCCKTCVDSCGDAHRGCPQEAQRGRCSDSRVLLQCKMSCGLCCSDYNPKCYTWARMNQCAANPEYMLKNCMKSCQACSSPVGSGHSNVFFLISSCCCWWWCCL